MARYIFWRRDCEMKGPRPSIGQGPIYPYGYSEALFVAAIMSSTVTFRTTVDCSRARRRTHWPLPVCGQGVSEYPVQLGAGLIISWTPYS